jgi:hypothetical protein
MAISRRDLFLNGGASAAALVATRGMVLAEGAPPPNETTMADPEPIVLQSPKGWARSVVSKRDVRLEVFQKGQGVTVLMHPSLGRPAQDIEDLGNRVTRAGYRAVLTIPEESEAVPVRWTT